MIERRSDFGEVGGGGGSQVVSSRIEGREDLRSNDLCSLFPSFYVRLSYRNGIFAH